MLFDFKGAATRAEMLFDFKGAATRAEWWILSILYTIVQVMVTFLGPVGAIVSIVIGILQIVVSVRRMHDMDKSGWWLLVPIYAWILIAFVPGTSGSGGRRSTNLSSVGSVVSSSTAE